MPLFSGRDEFETGLLKACVGLPTEANMNDTKNTWAGINQLTYGKKKKSKPISSLRRLNNNGITKDLCEISNISNKLFSSIGH